jgi:hypothetical protein
MNSLLFLQPYQVNNFYISLFFYKLKDKNHMVLEPFQSIIQIALLSCCKIGTKLTIQQNLLFLQIPSLVQPISRWYYADKKDDLYFLFPVIKKFIKWYNPNNKKSPISKELYDLIIKMSINGLKNLIKTYQNSNNITVIQVINMYIELLTISSHANEEKDYNELKEKIGDDINIDEIFEKIIVLYKNNLLKIIHNTLLILEEEDNNEAINNYITGLDLIMKKNNKDIQSWIKTKLIIT